MGAQSSEMDIMVSRYNRSTIPSMDHFLRFSRHRTELCLPLFLIFDLDAFAGYCWPSGKDTKDVFAGHRQSLLGLHSRRNTVNNQKQQKFPVRRRGRKIALMQEWEAMALEGGEHTAKQQGVEGNAPDLFWFLLFFSSLAVCLQRGTECARVSDERRKVSPSGVSKFKRSSALCIANLDGIYSPWIHNPFS